MNFIWFILIGGLAGWLAEKIMGKNMNLWQNIGLGILGAIVGGWLFGILGLFSRGLIGSLITALVGAIVLIWLFNFIKGRRR